MMVQKVNKLTTNQKWNYIKEIGVNQIPRRKECMHIDIKDDSVLQFNRHSYQPTSLHFPAQHSRNVASFKSRCYCRVWISCCSFSFVAMKVHTISFRNLGNVPYGTGDLLDWNFSPHTVTHHCRCQSLSSAPSDVLCKLP